MSQSGIIYQPLQKRDWRRIKRWYGEDISRPTEYQDPYLGYYIKVKINGGILYVHRWYAYTYRQEGPGSWSLEWVGSLSTIKRRSKKLQKSLMIEPPAGGEHFSYDEMEQALKVINQMG